MPREHMAITKKQKEEIVAKVSALAKGAKTLVFANFKGLTVAEQNEMRKGLRAQDIGYTVAKKTLIKRALTEQGYTGEIPELEGEIAVAYGEDELAPARELSTFVKKFGEHLSFAGGVFGGAFIDKAGIEEIASIPPLQTLRAQFVHVINSPIQKLAVVLSEAAKKQS